MKIAYLMRHDITKNDGVTKKVLDQTTEWKKSGHTVQVFCYVYNKGKSIIVDANQYKIRPPLKNKFVLENDLLKDLEVFSPDVVYYRYSTLNRTLRKVLSKYKVVTEVNTDDLGESKLLWEKERNLKSFARYFTYTLFRSQILKKVQGIIAVTKEIAELPSTTKYDKPTVYIPNGIDLEKYQTIKKQNEAYERVGLFFIGSPNQPWHGVDIIEEMSKKLPQYDFHIVGMEGDSSENLFWHGYLQKDEYLKILKKCQICIGTLALERKNMKEACPLKVREYLAYGYPTIIGYEDTAFLENDVDFILKLKGNKVSDEAIEKIGSFIELVKKMVVTSDLIQNIDIIELEKRRLSFIEDIFKN